MRVRRRRQVVVGLAVVSLGAAATVSLGARAGIAAPDRVAVGGVHHVGGDFDGDGKRDVVVGASGGDRVRVTYTSAHPGGSKVQWLTPPESSGNPSLYGVTMAVGDFNGDGFSDLAVGAPNWRNPVTVGDNPETQGALYLYDGSLSGLHYSGTLVHGQYNGDDPYNLASMMTAADTNQDGYADLAIKEEGGDLDQIEVFYGSNTGLNVGSPQLFTDFGARSMAFGDINHNGFPDLVLSDDFDLAHSSGPFNGAVRVINGSASGLTHVGSKVEADKFHARVGFGQSTAVGDINHDGYDDVVVGDAKASYFPHHISPGKIVIFLGGKHGISAKRIQVIDERAVSKHTRIKDLFGWSLAVAPVNGDKYPDVLVGAPGVKVGAHKAAGAVYLLRGSKHGVSTKHPQRLTQASHGMPGAPQTKAHFGQAVHLALLNADRFADAIIGAPDASNGAPDGGFYAILRGAAGGLVTRHAKGVGNSTSGDRLGITVAG